MALEITGSNGGHFDLGSGPGLRFGSTMHAECTIKPTGPIVSQGTASRVNFPRADQRNPRASDFAPAAPNSRSWRWYLPPRRGKCQCDRSTSVFFLDERRTEYHEIQQSLVRGCRRFSCPAVSARRFSRMQKLPARTSRQGIGQGPRRKNPHRGWTRRCAWAKHGKSIGDAVEMDRARFRGLLPSHNRRRRVPIEAGIAPRLGRVVRWLGGFGLTPV